MRFLPDRIGFRSKRGNSNLVAMGDLAAQSEEWEAAACHYRRALDEAPEDAAVWARYGRVLKHAGQPERAAAALRIAIEIDPSAADYHLEQADALRRHNRGDEAKAAYLRALVLAPDLAATRPELNGVAWTDAQLSQAREELTRQRKQRSKPTRITRADRARDAAHWDLAARLYREALENNPERGSIWIQYGHVSKEAGRLAEAETAYRRAIACDPAQADPYLHLGHVFKILGRTEDAQSAYLHALALAPQMIDAAEELSRLGLGQAAVAQIAGIELEVSEAELTGLRHRRGSNPEPVSGPTRSPAQSSPNLGFRARLEACGLFDPETYLGLHPDLGDGVTAWDHFERFGLDEGRHFTSAEVVARVLASSDAELRKEQQVFRTCAERTLANLEKLDLPDLSGIRVGIFSNSEGNFYMHEFAELLAWGLADHGIDTARRDERGDRGERFDLRIFVAPHEFFYLGKGSQWAGVASAPNTVLYNVEQLQTKWFCRTFSLLLRAPLVLDVNFQSAVILRKAGCNVLHFMPGYLPSVPYTRPQVDIRRAEIVKGYDFAYQPYNWQEGDQLEDRPIDLLFVGSQAPRRDTALARFQDLADTHRFICAYTRQDAPLTAENHTQTSTQINCALGQRTKIILNIHREWLGYFEWSRMVLQGIWQCACVISDPCLPNPLFEPGIHYLEENARHLGELARWLLTTTDGREKMNTVRKAGYQRAREMGSMRVALAPVLRAFAQITQR